MQYVFYALCQTQWTLYFTEVILLILNYSSGIIVLSWSVYSFLNITIPLYYRGVIKCDNQFLFKL